MLFQPYVLVVSKCFKCSKTERKKNVHGEGSKGFIQSSPIFYLTFKKTCADADVPWLV